jgi:hypothetical protein
VKLENVKVVCFPTAALAVLLVSENSTIVVV